MSARRWQAAEGIALDQLGLITHRQLLGCGFASSSVHVAVGSRRLTKVHRGVFSLGPISSDPRVRLLAAVLAAGPGAAASHLSAASHQGLVTPGSGPITVTTPTMGGRSRPGIRIHRRRLQAVELTTFDAVPCTTTARTILDLCEISAQLGERAVRSAGAKGLLRVAELQQVLEINRGRRGTARMRMLLDDRRPVPAFARSELERLTYELCERSRLPMPDVNVDVWAGGAIYECDCVWPSERLIIECDSRWHDNPVTARRDARRDEALTLAGWRVHRIRWAQFTASPGRVAATIDRLLTDQRRVLAATTRR
jgi:very-short-patch-repair endonuclease